MNKAVLQAIEQHALTPEAIEQVIALAERDDAREQYEMLVRNGPISKSVSAVLSLSWNRPAISPSWERSCGNWKSAETPSIRTCAVYVQCRDWHRKSLNRDLPNGVANSVSPQRKVVLSYSGFCVVASRVYAEGRRLYV